MILTMKNRHKILFSGLLMAAAISAQSQSLEDGLRFSQNNVSGSARFQGLAGAGSALGGDISSAALNPAGLGFFRKSEFSFSGALGFASNQTTYLENKTRDGKVSFNVPNFGLVLATGQQNNQRGLWRGGAFSFSLQRLANFQNQFTYEGDNNRTSFLDYLAENASNVDANLDDISVAGINDYGYYANNRNSGGSYYDDLALAQLAYKNYLINPIPATNNGQIVKDSQGNTVYTTGYYASIGQAAKIRQRETINTTGAANQWNIGYGGNVADKFYFGANVGIVSVNYGLEKKLNETVLETTPVFIEEQEYSRFIDDYTYTERVNARGSGLNISGGIIYRPNDIIRFGASITSPTSIRIREDFSKDISARFYQGAISNGTTSTQANNNPVRNEYTITRPWRASGGVAVFLGKNGFITADAEYVPYNSITLNANGDRSSGDTRFKSAVNLRLGGEARLDVFRVRAGFAYQDDPHRKNGGDDLDRKTLNFTLGGGIRQSKWFMDVAAIHSRRQSGYTPYMLGSDRVPSAITQNAATNVVLTVGTFF